MKKTIVLAKTLILALALAIPFLTLAGLEPKNVTLLWEYDPSEMTNLVFVVRHSTDPSLPLESWPVFGVTANTNMQFQLMPGRHFFTVQASNFWGMSSDFSEVASTPGVAAPVQRLAITRP
jgi:hypothetical protein